MVGESLQKTISELDVRHLTREEFQRLANVPPHLLLPNPELLNF